MMVKVSHLGVEKCYLQIRNAYFLPHMKKKIDKYIKNCVKCVALPPLNSVTFWKLIKFNTSRKLLVLDKQTDRSKE